MDVAGRRCLDDPAKSRLRISVTTRKEANPEQRRCIEDNETKEHLLPRCPLSDHLRSNMEPRDDISALFTSIDYKTTLLPDVGHDNDNHDDDAIDNPDADASPDLELDDKATIDLVAEPDPGNNENPEGLPEDGIQKNDLQELNPDVTAAKSSVHFHLETAHMEVEEFTLAQAVSVKLEELGIENDIWNQAGPSGDEYNYWQVTFVLEKEQCDDVLRHLTKLGIGRIQGTSISLFPANYHESQCAAAVKAKKDLLAAEKKNKFLKSINSRLVVAQVVQSVHSSSVLTFDFVMFVVLASMIAAVGLAENSSVILVASMLVSPIMGPILAGTFGLVIFHRNLCKLGIKNELISLSICIISGFLFGLLMGAVNYNGNNWGSTDEWPTSEMKNRGLLRGLWVGVLIAVPSGAGVALSILSGNMGSLVGVAISASLLPPAVNAGMLWAYSLVSIISSPPLNNVLGNVTNVTYSNMQTTDSSLPTHQSSPVPPDCPNLVHNDYEFVYSCSMAKETAILGTVSLILTLINIICIFIMGVVVLSIKKVVPEKMVPEYARSFWKNDIQIAKHTYQTLKPSLEATACAGQMAREMAKQFREQIFPDKPVQGLKSSWYNLMKAVQEKNDYTLLSNLTGSSRPQLVKQFSLFGESVLDETIELEERKYNTVTGAIKIMSSPSSLVSNEEFSRGLKWGVLRSPEGTEQFLYDPVSANKRHKRYSWCDSSKLKNRKVSVPKELELTDNQIPTTASSPSGKK
ncbi:hypothetical protein LSH36_68g09013 [Paralvinella palmiformis]|uniref:DUF389 domain-containing protein n=1 Tax=Paralvinella palmiformis TaxID=53620 RepID=A0AAD9K4D4_9ANNE|nr:hypothetical protein LSH36_68g09013 [Paralvinella palmiformis]